MHVEALARNHPCQSSKMHLQALPQREDLLERLWPLRFVGGLARGIYSNDSGNGLTSIAHSNADVKHPVQQGLWGVFEVFFDTIIVCLCNGSCCTRF